MRVLAARVVCSVLIGAAVFACASGVEVEPLDAPVSEDPGRQLPLPDDAAPDAMPKTHPKPTGDGKSGADAAPAAPPAGAIIADGTDQGQAGGSVLLDPSATVEGHIDDDDSCPSTDPWVQGSFPFATVTIHNPLSTSIWVDVRADSTEVSVAAYSGTSIPMTMAERRACEVSSFKGYLVDSVYLDAYESKLLFVTSAAPLGPNVTTGVVPLRLTTFL